ncbi:helix-turn-helix transcriptional regulator [Clostridium ljungdahlii]|uniref:Helix-turn-helix domain protein n=1 Tax=Clostridium ljungdahlii (strain ATCC 55383 / DSM 13528 / PETC) TaxID=748727 RepID=D8GTA8_CLOLD|nr:helix-turn-helix transcriptional regulator [Clostridium ljungdahlii]ADK16707.1 putative transcriptional regulator [Clostridium ljungdahlii DSM 13528]OAA89417.1 Helix-turn-helix domain protein [Clostridium ljungdahlii DSM 13528]
MKITPIRLRRLNAGIETGEAINKLDISKSTFYKIEQGHLKPSRDLILKMSRLYDCSTDEIFKALKI